MERVCLMVATGLQWDQKVNYVRLLIQFNLEYRAETVFFERFKWESGWAYSRRKVRLTSGSIVTECTFCRCSFCVTVLATSINLRERSEKGSLLSFLCLSACQVVLFRHYCMVAFDVNVCDRLYFRQLPHTKIDQGNSLQLLFCKLLVFLWLSANGHIHKIDNNNKILKRKLLH